VAIALLFVFVSSAAEWHAKRISIAKGFNVPECTLFVGSPFFDVFVSNISAKEGGYWTDDGKGFISLISSSGAVIKLSWLESSVSAPIHAPKGMCFANGCLYFTDNARLMRCTIGKTGKPGKLEQLALPAAENLNDLATDSYAVVVSDTKLGKVYHVECATGKVREIPAPESVNGVTIYRGKIFAVSWGLHEIYELDRRDGKAPQPFGLGSHFTNLDGIEVLSDGTFIVSDFMGNRIATVSADRKTVRTLIDVESPADIGLDPTFRTLYVPQFLKNQVVVYRLENR
jgi:hypothetical protein